MTLPLCTLTENTYCENCSVIKLRAWCRATEGFHDSNRAPAALATCLVLHLRRTSHASSPPKLFLVRGMSPILPGQPRSASFLSRNVSASGAQRPGENGDIFISWKNRTESFILTCIHTGSPRCPGLQNAPRNLPGCWCILPKHVLTRSCRRNTAQSRQPSPRTGPGASSYDALHAPEHHSPVSLGLPAAGQLFPAPQKSTMLRSLRQVVPQRCHCRLCERGRRGGLKQEWNDIDVPTQCVFVHGLPLRVGGPISGCMNMSPIFHPGMTCRCQGKVSSRPTLSGSRRKDEIPC